MAKRKRLTPAQPDYLNAPLAAPEVKSALGPAPIAQVAGAASAIAALQEVTAAMRDARAEGRLVQRLPLASVAGDHLTRDRLAADAEDLDALVASIREHGQRNPIEVMELPDGRFGLISGWRRLTALEQLAAEPGGEKFATVLALLRTPENASDAYVSMVEENEIRVGLSYYERARVVALVVEQGVFPTEKIALARLFAAASRAKRSKIGSFLRVFHALDDVLRFPTHLGERQG
ncbi:MAG: ParB N-terminal domain-containing protein, partial [Rhodobacteraceae bacterium]|nr:ParB N-terminal domain-containing protein [Paracoccaceae bacterium]